MAEVSQRLQAALDAGVGGGVVVGVSVGRADERKTWRLDFHADATAQQKASALAIVNAFNPLEPVPEPTDEQKLERLFASVGLTAEKGRQLLRANGVR